MAYEIDYIAVGDGECSGDAIALRYGSALGSLQDQTVVVIDGGFKESGEQLVELINKYYGTNVVNLVVSTHPDRDHSSGLSVVLEKMTVKNLLMHRPWQHTDSIKRLLFGGRLTLPGIKKKFEKSLQHAKELESLAEEKGIPIHEPFSGLSFDNSKLLVLGPSQEFYEGLLPQFLESSVTQPNLGILEILKKTAQDQDVVEWIDDHVGIDLLDDDEDTTSPINNTSTIMLLVLDGHKMLFTGDAGKTALLEAIDYASANGINLTDLHFLDVPHHGSKRNLSSRVLKQIKAEFAYVSASKESKKHPAKKITNALQKNGAKVYVTRGTSILKHNEGNARGWNVSAVPEIFHPKVEA